MKMLRNNKKLIIIIIGPLTETANKAETLQSQDATKKFNGANLIFIL
jgi:hypothetical protein